MALHILNLFTLFTIFLFMIIVIKIRNRSKKYDSSTKRIPPGPLKLPIIGNIINLITTNPPRKLRDLSKIYGPLMHLQLGEVFFVVVSSPEVAREVLKTHDINFASRPHLLAVEIAAYNSTGMAFSPYGNYWRQLRKICAIELLSSRRVKSLWPVRENEIRSLLKKVASNEGSEFNLTQEVISMVYTFTSKAAFGKKYLEQEEFISVVKQLIKLAGGFYIGDLFPSAKWIQNLSGMRPKLEKLSQQLDRILEKIINDHKDTRSRKANKDVAEAEKDLIDCLSKFEDSGSDEYFYLTTDNIKAIILDVFTAGGVEEGASHLFLSCDFAYGVWLNICRWLGFSTVMPCNLFVLFEYFVGFAPNKKVAKGFALIWLTTVWSIWRSRNEVVFSNGVRDVVKVVDDVKHLSWQWGMSRRAIPFCLFYDWCCEPGICLR
ncbi:cytochrome P450 71D11 [Trifolium repens]|nr:cytochrome P450 71D11 [Trifolium repens]